jgi:predicted transposase YbfD/YdcC
MQSTSPSALPTTPTVTAGSLLAACQQLPDPRRRASTTYSVAGLVAAGIAALLCGQPHVSAIAHWIARQSPELRQALGLPPDQVPHQTTVHRLFQRLDATSVAHTLATSLQQSLPIPESRGAQAIAVDGKACRGARQEEDSPVVQVLSGFCQEWGVTLAEEPVHTGRDKVEAELTAAPRLLQQVDWQDRVLTGDALYCQRALCQAVLAGGGDYLLTVKANQHTLHRHLMRTFDAEGRPLLDLRHAQTIDKGHGRIERRTIRVTADSLALPDWPGVAQVFQWTRTWWEHGQRHQQIRYGITSLPRPVAGPARLLRLKRGHWLIENRGHRAKDVCLAEDASLVHRGQAPQLLSALRNAALSLLYRAGYHRITDRLRFHSQFPDQAVALLLQPAPPHA